MAIIIDSTNSVFGGLNVAKASDGPITVKQDGILSVTDATGGSYALYLDESKGYSILVEGIISAESELGNTPTGIRIPNGAPGVTSTIKVAETGMVTGANYGIDSGHALKLTNAGLIAGNFYGVYSVGVQTTSTIINTGTILATNATGVSVGFNGGIAGGTLSLTNKGLLDGEVRTFATLDILKLANSGTITEDVVLNSGADSISNTGSINGNVSLGDGLNVMANKGLLQGNLLGGDSGNKLSNAGKIFGSLDTGAGSDVLANSGLIDGYVRSGEGNDVFKNTGTVTQAIVLGGGDDVFTGGNMAEVVEDGAGVDKYVLGKGDDRFHAINSATQNLGVGQDFVDGGANTAGFAHNGNFGDIYDAQMSYEGNFAAAGIKINLGSVAVNDVMNIAPSLIAANSAQTGADIDVVKNFETVFGTNHSDTIIGDKLGNAIYGNNGVDYLYGMAGDDLLDGGNNNDFLNGGLGRDKLASGSGVDKFYYGGSVESTSKSAGRDFITDFADGSDTFQLEGDLAAINSFVGENGLFTGAGNEIRAWYTIFGWLIEADLNGDKKSDFAVEVWDKSHAITWSATDFGI